MKTNTIRCLGLLLTGMLVGEMTWPDIWPHGLAAAQAVEKQAEPSAAVKALMAALQDMDAEVRRNAVLSLGRMGPEARAAVSALTEALKDKDVDVRGAA